MSLLQDAHDLACSLQTLPCWQVLQSTPGTPKQPSPLQRRQRDKGPVREVGELAAGAGVAQGDSKEALADSKM